MPSYRAAIIGCGSIGHAHMDGYRLVDGVDVVAIVDPVAEAREHYIEQYEDLSLQPFATVEEMLEQVKPDIVSVCTWHLLHPAPTIAAAGAGVKAVICEKPMAIGMGAADSMVEACAASGTKLVISHQRRFTPGWERARQLLAEGVIGDPEFVTNKVREGLTNWGTHTIDGSRFVLGDPRAEWVMGAVERGTDRYERDTAIEDACMGLIHFETGVQLFIQSDLMAEGASAGAFQIRGSEGQMDVTETTVRILNGDGWLDADVKLDDDYKGIGGSTNAAQVRELLSWLEGGPEHRGAGHTARETVEVMMALYESARRNEVIRLPMEEKGYPLELMINEGKLPVRHDGRYDIRAFLSWEGIDRDAYRRLRDEGIGHHQAMRQLHESIK